MVIIHRCAIVSFYFCILWRNLAYGSLVEETKRDKSINIKSKEFDACINCDKQQAPVHNHKKFTSNRHSLEDSSSINKIFPEESEKVIYSRKYNPEIMSHADDFIPVPGPYGMKSSRLARHNLKPTVSHRFRPSGPRNINTVVKHAHNKHHVSRAEDLNSQQNVQRRVQFRHPKATEDLTVKESIANENILGNGNFEIIRGGIYSDQEGNEIIGSRRIGRGFGSFGISPYQQQSRFNPIQSIQFPPVYQGRIQNQVNPVFYPRAPYYQ